MQLGSGLRVAWGVICVVAAVGCGGDVTPEADDKNPCQPNPCKQAGKTQCEVVSKAAVCGCDEGLAPDGRGGCASTDSWSPGVAGNAVSSSGAQQYLAHVQVVDSDDQPIEGATLQVGTRAIKTNVEGRAPFADMDTSKPTYMRITADGYVPVSRQLTIVNAGMRELVVKLVKLDAPQKFAAGSPATLEAGSVRIVVPARAFVTELERTRVQGEIVARLTDFAVDGTDERAWPGGRQARSPSGQPTMVERWYGAVHAEFEDSKGMPLQLGPGSTATLAVLLPADANVANGDEIGLWSLDKDNGLWSLESSCKVSVTASGAKTQKLCEGRVPHFSIWAVGVEWDIYKPGSVGCLNVTLDVKLPDVNVANTQSIHVMQCDGDKCYPNRYWWDGNVAYIGEEKSREALCGLASPKSDLGVALELRVAHKTGAMGGVEPGVYVYEAPRVDLQSFKEKLGAQVLLNQTFDLAGDCETLCAQVHIEIDEKVLGNLQRYVDDDLDGFVSLPKAASAPGDDDAGVPVMDEAPPPQAPPVVLGKFDCNDKDKRVYPNAYEPRCGGTDYDCDGKLPEGGQLTWQEVPDSYIWNYGICGTKCASPDTKETKGNFYDEDCDGKALDVDGDGYLPWYHSEDRDDPFADTSKYDCNDYAAEAHPGGTEVPGNVIDEDCDYVWLDYDNDGVFSWGHEGVALNQLGLDPDQQPERFGDCDDGWATAKPKQKLEYELGQLQSLYRPLGGGNYARTEYFCSFFNDDGKPNSSMEWMVRDVNCDGWLTDMDGDGWTDPRDTTLGENRAFDCNDYDPRVHPIAEPTRGADGKLIPPKCVSPAEKDLIDDSVCAVNATELGDGCPPLPLEGQSVPTSCWKVPNTQMLDLAICIFNGWETNGGPLKWKPGQAWGPCDGASGDPSNKLAACPDGYMCGGGGNDKFKYSEGLRTYLKDRYTGGADLKYEGMCFKTCKHQ